MATNGMKSCVSLVNDAKAVENAAMVLEETLEKFKNSVYPSNANNGWQWMYMAPVKLQP